MRICTCLCTTDRRSSAYLPLEHTEARSTVNFLSNRVFICAAFSAEIVFCICTWGQSAGSKNSSNIPNNNNKSSNGKNNYYYFYYNKNNNNNNNNKNNNDN